MTAKAYPSTSAPESPPGPGMRDIELERLVAAEPTNVEALHRLGMACALNGQLGRAEALIRRAVAIKPDFVEALCNLGRILHERQRPDEAIAFLGRAVTLQPGYADAHFVMGLACAALDRLEEARACYDRVIGLRPDFAPAYTHRGVVETRLNRPADALASHDRAIALQPDFADAHGNRGDVLQGLNRLDEALASYDAAISLRPDFPPEYLNRGNVLEKLQRYDEAVASYDKAIALEPHSADSRYNRARVLYEMNRIEEALAEYDVTLKIAPGFALAKNNVFSHFLGELKDLSLIERLCADASALNLQQYLASPAARNTIFGFRIVHDFEQTRYLLAEGYTQEWLRRAHRRLEDLHRRHIAGRSDPPGDTLIRLSDQEADDVNLFRNALLRYAPATAVEHCLNPANDWAAIEEQYFSSFPEIVYIDDLLSPQALQELRKFCLVSTVWKKEYKNQYLGAFANAGFLSALHLRIALELKQRMPRIFGEHRLEQLWAFKYNPVIRKGINAHADFAKVNLNFWITPDDANLHSESGGLIVYEVPSPPSWSLKDYNRDESAIHEFLKARQSGSRRIPYRCNRAVLFNSALFHETDDIHFKEGYENRRINITYLFGKELRTY